jgi:hypothetical protein
MWTEVIAPAGEVTGDMPDILAISSKLAISRKIHFLEMRMALRRRSPPWVAPKKSAPSMPYVGAKVASHDGLEVHEGLRGIRRAWKQPPEQKAPVVDVEVRRPADAGRRKRARVSGTGRSCCWVLPARCAAQNSWRSMSNTCSIARKG